jgi:hypothetical protein
MQKRCNELQSSSVGLGVVVPILSVSPFGEFAMSSTSAALMGNRGILHSAGGVIDREWEHEHWISCELTACGPIRRGSRRRYTRLLFSDEAVALAVGHRPCSRCRPAAYDRFRHAWKRATKSTTRKSSFEVIDRSLHKYRTRSLQGVRELTCRAGELPSYTFVALPGAEDAFLLDRQHLYRWSNRGYDAPQHVSPDQLLTTITPVPMIEVLRAGYELEAVVAPKLTTFLRASPQGR